MIDFLVATVAAILVLLGLAVIVGPDVPRFVRALVALIRHARESASAARDAPAATAHGAGESASTLRAITAANSAAVILRRHGHDELASRLAHTARRLASDEANGLRSTLALRRRLERVRLDDEAAQAALDRQVHELLQSASDRAEQLELLPFRS